MAEQALWKQYRSRIDALTELPVNFDLDRQHEYTAEHGWHIDHYAAELPPEPPGQPLPNGSWVAAQKMMREYRFPDPKIVTGIYYPDKPLEQRVMLLRARAFGMSFFFGVKIGGVLDTTKDGEHGPEQVWGFNYQTLKGHFERGQMDFSVAKELGSGKVFFRIDAFSQQAEIANPIFRLGFHLFGRRVQVRFAKRALARMQSLVTEELRAQQQGRPAERGSEPAVQPASSHAEAAEKLETINDRQ